MIQNLAQLQATLSSYPLKPRSQDTEKTHKNPYVILRHLTSLFTVTSGFLASWYRTSVLSVVLSSAQPNPFQYLRFFACLRLLSESLRRLKQSACQSSGHKFTASRVHLRIICIYAVLKYVFIVFIFYFFFIHFYSFLNLFIHLFSFVCFTY